MEVELFESIPNFSEGRDGAVIDAIAGAAPPSHVLDVDPDPDHHRVVISVAGSREHLIPALLDMAAAAVERIDLSRHLGVHPRVGAADVIPIVPLGKSSLEACRGIAHQLGARIWEEIHVPVYFYGHGEAWTLADIRAGRAQLDIGGPDLHPTGGAVCIGARRPLVAFNVLLPGSTAADARALARSLRESSGGLRGVMALVFELPEKRLQLSMNLFRLDETSPDDVLDELARREVRFEAPQVVGLCPAIAAAAPAAGRLLEGRVGSAAARAGAVKCRELGGEEMPALAARLDRESEGLARIGVTQDEILAGAERCAALPPVFRAAGLVDPELETLALIAAQGFRDALSAETASTYAARIAALDRRLEASS